MSGVILVLNAGSSSLKFAAFPIGAGELLVRGQVAGLGTHPRLTVRNSRGETIEERDLDGGASVDHEQAFGLIAKQCKVILDGHHLVAIGHRVVHGGVEFTTPVLIDDSVLEKLDSFSPLAPLHQPHNLAAIRAVGRQVPNIPQVACFDTAFHRTQPEVAQQFGLPRRFTAEGVRRYGFHGLSYEYVASALSRIDSAAASGRTIVAHLGNGASMCAMSAGKSVASTMSFTPADGLLMGTRCGSLDPGVMLYLMATHGMNAKQLEELIYHQSGLLGVSGQSSDMQILLQSDDPHAIESVDLFVYRIGRELGSLAAALGGVDALVFTGGIGENAASVRDRVVRDAAWLGPIRVHVVQTDEELMIAEHTRRVLGLMGASQ